MPKIPPSWTSWAIACVIVILRWTCRVRVHNDPREELRARGVPYVYSILHAHQVSSMMYAEPGTAAMVSHSGDGQLLMRAFQVMRAIPVRGSNHRGGAEAAELMVEHLKQGRQALLAVDGPRGPRSRVRKGIARLAQASDAAVLNIVIVPRWRLVFPRAWDRFQVPLPFSRIDAYFAEPIVAHPGERVEAIRRRIETSLVALERRYDPKEALAAGSAGSAEPPTINSTAA